MVDGGDVRVVPFGDDAVLVELSGLTEVRALDDAVRAARATDPQAAAIVDQVPAARTLLLRVRAGADPRELPVLRWWSARSAPAADRAVAEVVLTVEYDGPDLADVARLTGLTADEVVTRHTAGRYTVAFGGFMPGFAYLTGLDPVLRVPRLDSPRVRVPAGAVAVADEFTAVYPAPTPGGWRLLGRCDLDLFDVERQPPALLQPGTRVRFTAA
ncbi:5-oxoprolinase subunit B family protein [Cellulomonas fengjieae]|uniref:5-oxoprolinase subunit B family protein n=1 Tax=Cellulomonas fengjieae TaxID=2819978 RepID=UPI001AAF2BE3|nr:allophanate hydrolase subunit 1 [Cellulomonas fengjieae]MBO3101826.1 allophanate hydrolase subunit 1 [Cellulomonas fengjieae]